MSTAPDPRLVGSLEGSERDVRRALRRMVNAEATRKVLEADARRVREANDRARLTERRFWGFLVGYEIAWLTIVAWQQHAALTALCAVLTVLLVAKVIRA